MQCPSCSVTLRLEKSDYVTFDVCSDCWGIWVAGEQFRALAVKVATEGDVKPDEKLMFKPRKVIVPGRNQKTTRNCPKCHKAMREFNYAYDSNVFLDRCQQCQGIWLDSNEIIDIAKHIQYNPKMHMLGKSLLNMKSNPAEQELTKAEMLLQLAAVILRVLIFRC